MDLRVERAPQTGIWDSHTMPRLEPWPFRSGSLSRNISGNTLSSQSRSATSWHSYDTTTSWICAESANGDARIDRHCCLTRDIRMAQPAEGSLSRCWGHTGHGHHAVPGQGRDRGGAAGDAPD